MRAVVVYEPPFDNTRAVAQAVARASTEPSTLPSCRQVIITDLLFGRCRSPSRWPPGKIEAARAGASGPG